MTNPFELFLPGDYVQLTQDVEDRADKGDICQYMGRFKEGYALQPVNGDEALQLKFQHFIHVDKRLSDLDLSGHIEARRHTIRELTKGIDLMNSDINRSRS